MTEKQLAELVKSLQDNEQNKNQGNPIARRVNSREIALYCPCCRTQFNADFPVKKKNGQAKNNNQVKTYNSTAVGIGVLAIVILLISMFFSKVFENDKKAQKAIYSQEYYDGR